MVCNYLPKSAAVRVAVYQFDVQVGMMFHNPDIEIGMMLNDFHTSVKRFALTPAILNRRGGNKCECNYQ